MLIEGVYYCEVIETKEVYRGYEVKIVETIAAEKKLSLAQATQLLKYSSINAPIECNTERFWREYKENPNGCLI